MESQRIAIQSRYPEYTDKTKAQRYDGSKAVLGHYTGEWRENTTNFRNAIIPLTTSFTIGGISGIIPLNIFKINTEKLPKGYQNPNIVFVVKTESQKITSGQDWTTTFTGYLSLLNDHANKGYNESGTSSNISVSLQKQAGELGSRDAYNDWVKDHAWSACFVSYCVSDSILNGNLDPKLSWIMTDSMRHTTYFDKNKDQGGFSHMDPKTTPLVKGDILLQSNKVNKKGIKYPGPYSGASHANIVVDINEGTGEVKVVGGNMGSGAAGTQTVMLLKFKGIKKIVKTPGDPAMGIFPKTYTHIYLDPSNGITANNGPYIEGSILRSADLIGENGRIIGETALREKKNWKKGWTETSKAAEPTMRKYYAAGGYDPDNQDPPAIYKFAKLP